MAVFKCKMCGGDLTVTEGMKIVECDYCGTKQTVPNAKDENLHGLFNRANILRMKSEFDKAEQIYEKILQADESQAEAYWGLILCKYGIEYVEDPATFKRVPTCHRTSFDSIIADEDYKSALQYADNIQRGLYESEAKEIDRLQKEILAISQKEEPYDVFICYKETDETGRRTQDSAIANDIYYQLTNEGFKVFYAAITLEDKLGSAYEPCIFAALNSAKVMLAVGTKPEHFNAVWVKNEWSRFLKMMKNDRSKMLIPCYRDMDAYDLPEEFAHLQAQDMSKIGFINDLVRGIKKVIHKENENSIVQEQKPSSFSSKPVSETASDFKEVYDSSTFSKPQRIMFLISVVLNCLMFGIRKCLELPFPGNSVITILVDVAILCAFLGCSIASFRSKKKDSAFIISSVFLFIMNFSAYFTQLSWMSSDGEFFYYASWVLFLIYSCFCTIPSLHNKTRWLRFFFWIPPLMVTFGFVLFGYIFNVIFNLLGIVSYLFFMFAAVAPMRRKTNCTYSVREFKNKTIKNSILLICSIAVTVTLIPSFLMYMKAMAYEADSDYSEAVYCYKKSIFMSEENIHKLMYTVAKDEDQSRYTRRSFLKELAEEDYKDSEELYKELCQWHVEFYGCYRTEDESTRLDYVPRSNEYLSVSFKLKGGDGDPITVYHTTKWPDSNKYVSDWDWENQWDGDLLSFVYENGIKSDQGNLVIEFYNRADDSLIETVVIPIK